MIAELGTGEFGGKNDQQWSNRGSTLNVSDHFLLDFISFFLQ
jgi:hypothetical protein